VCAAWNGSLPSSPQHHPTEYQKHIDLWLAFNPGLFRYYEAMFHTHQAYAVADLNMTLLLVTSLLPDARDYDVAIAANILRFSPGSSEMLGCDGVTEDRLGWRGTDALWVCRGDHRRRSRRCLLLRRRRVRVRLHGQGPGQSR
jgi:hypothetical protein